MTTRTIEPETTTRAGATVVVPLMPGPTGLHVTATPAMVKDEQSIFQCSECGTVVVQPRPAVAKLGPCPVCSTTHWWGQTLPVAGLHTPGLDCTDVGQ